MPGLQLRNSTYHFRRPVPPDLVEIVGKREWKRSLRLKPGQELKAHAQADRLWKQTEEQIVALRRELANSEDPVRLAKKAAQWANDFQLLDGQAGATREAAWINGEKVELDSQRDLHIVHIIEAAGREFGWDEQGHPKRLSPEQEARLAVLIEGKPIDPPMTVSQARDIYLADKERGPADKATAQGTQQFIDMVGDMELSQISRPMVIKWLRELRSERGQAPATVRRRLTTMRAIYNHMRKNYELKSDNPFASQDLPANVDDDRKRVPFHTKHFELIEAYLIKPDTDPHVRRIITLLKHTGCRPMEIGGLSKSEVYLDLEIPAIQVRWTADRRLKAKSAKRLVPLIGPALIAAREAVAAAEGDTLFPSKFLKTDRLSQTLNGAIRDAGVPKSPNRLIAYSFRHSMKEALRLAAVLEETQDALMGHAKAEVAARYGADRKHMHILKDALQRATPHLGDIVETQYLPGELP
ncbi:DUF6538 domain-containing protein [Maricaulis parjimensis]|uniref:DUF6538 domain-containing protein n=1 Tax=Maricaulis parjimensis TaxID=144023 RepID=UPI00308419D1